MEDISKQIINELQYLIEIMTSCWTLSDLLPFYKLSEDSIENFIINLFRVFINTYPQETVNALIHSWESASKNVETKLKII